MTNRETPSQSTSKGEREGNELPAKVHDAAEQIRSAASKRVESVRHTAEVARAEAADKVRKFGHAVRKIGEHMRVEEQYYVADHANSAGQRIDTVADYIDAAELKTLLQDAEGAARSKPVWVYSGALLLGLAAGRFLKGPGGSSSSQLAKLPAEPKEVPEVRDLQPAPGADTNTRTPNRAVASKPPNNERASAVRR